jgi:hypothetical protein
MTLGNRFAIPHYTPLSPPKSEDAKSINFRVADNPRSRDSGVVLTGSLIPHYTPTHSGQTLRAPCTVRKRVPPMYAASSKEGGIES